MKHSLVWPLGVSLVIVSLVLFGSALVLPAASGAVSESALPPQAAPARAVACADNYEPNNDFESARLLSINTGYYAAICDKDDWDYYAFEVPENSHLRAYITSLPADFDIYLYNSVEYEVGKSGNLGLEDEEVNYNTAAGGVFVLFVLANRPDTYSDDPYKFGLDVTPLNTATPTETRTRTPTPTSTSTRTRTATPTPGCADPYEPNETFETAWPITPGDYLSYICELTDQDYFEFAVALHENVEVWLLELPADYDLYLYNPAQSQEGQSVNTGKTNEHVLMTDAKLAGQYRVLVAPKAEYSRTTPYKLRVQVTHGATATPTRTPTPPTCSTDEWEPNDTFAAAHTIPLGVAIQGLICPPGDRDFFKFSATAGRTISVKGSSLPADYDLYLWSPAGVEVAHSWNSGTADEVILYYAPQTGEYRAEVRPVYGEWHATAAYNLRVDVLTATSTPTRTPSRTPTRTRTPTRSPTPSPTPDPEVDLTVEEIEINQNIQTFTYPYFAPIWHKPTVVRVWIDIGRDHGGCVGGVTAVIDVRDTGGGLVRRLFPYNPGGAICVSADTVSDKWYHLNAALNFDVPADLLQGSYIYDVWVNPDSTVHETDYTNNHLQQTVQFRPIAKRLSVAYFLIGYRPSGYSGATFATDRIQSAIGFLKTTWPIRPDYVSYWPAPIGPFPWDVYLDVTYDYWRLLHEVYDFWYDMNPQPDHLVGWLPSDARQTTGGVVGFGYVGDLDDPENAVWAMDRDTGTGPIILSHELLHNWSFGHSCNTLGGRGFDVLNRGVKSSGLHEVMCDTVSLDMWADVSKYYTLYSQWWAPLPYSAADTPKQVSIAPTLYVRASGVITPSEGTAELWPLEVVTRTETVPLPATGDTCLDFMNGGTLLAHRCFQPLDGETNDEGPAVNAFFLNLPWPEGTTRVVLKSGSTVLAQRAASAHKPTIHMISPNGGETWGDTATVQWSAQDADGNPLSYSVLYSWDGGESWTPLGPDVTTTSTTISTTLLPGGDQSLVKVRVTDGFYSAEAMSAATFTVPRKSPQATIETPLEGAAYRTNEPIVMTGQGYDPEDGILPDDHLYWYLYTPTSSVYLGSGPMVTVDPQVRGEHTIVINVEDSDGNVGVAFRNFFVGERGDYNVFLPAVFR